MSIGFTSILAVLINTKTPYLIHNLLQHIIILFSRPDSVTELKVDYGREAVATHFNSFDATTTPSDITNLYVNYTQQTLLYSDTHNIYG